MNSGPLSTLILAGAVPRWNVNRSITAVLNGLMTHLLTTPLPDVLPTF